MNKNKIICVVGPTSSGKSSLAVNIAKEYDAEIISCDSMQLYKGMDIGTAKTTKEEMCEIPHHLTDILEINENFSVSDYITLADECVKDIIMRGKLPVFCGGTGLYIDSYISGLEFAEYDNIPEYRKELEKFANENGTDKLHNMLMQVDKDAAEKIPPENVKRVIRALEVYKSTGVPITEWNKKAKENAKPKNALFIGIRFEDRSLLYDRIDKRVDIMLENGLLDEAKKLIEKGIRQTLTAGQAIGYKEFYPYFDGEKTLFECIERLKINTRHYAKRQLTWFMRNEKIAWITADNKTEEEIFESAKKLCDDFLEI